MILLQCAKNRRIISASVQRLPTLFSTVVWSLKYSQNSWTHITKWVGSKTVCSKLKALSWFKSLQNWFGAPMCTHPIIRLKHTGILQSVYVASIGLLPPSFFLITYQVAAKKKLCVLHEMTHYNKCPNSILTSAYIASRVPKNHQWKCNHATISYHNRTRSITDLERYTWYTLNKSKERVSNEQ